MPFGSLDPSSSSGMAYLVIYQYVSCDAVLAFIDLKLKHEFPSNINPPPVLEPVSVLV